MAIDIASESKNCMHDRQAYDIQYNCHQNVVGDIFLIDSDVTREIC